MQPHKKKPLLLKRAISRGKTYEETTFWHKLTRVRTPQVFKKGNILTKGMNNYPNFTINNLNDLKFVGGGAGVYAIILDEDLLRELKINKYFLLGLLNSSTYSFYFRNIGAVKRGGYYQISGYQIDGTPVIIPKSEKDLKLIEKISEEVKEIYELNEDIDIKTKIVRIWKEFQSIPIMQSSLINQLQLPEGIKETEDIKIKRQDYYITTTGDGVIECKNEVIAKCIEIILKYSDWINSSTPKEDLISLNILENIDDYTKFLNIIKEFLIQDDEIVNKRIEKEKRINVLVYQIFGFSEEEKTVIEQKFVEPWVDY